jgi:hypothetical protein
VREEVDHGEILVLSKPVKIELEHSFAKLEKDKALRKEIVSGYQDKLKVGGDWVIYPLTIQMISRGRFALGSEGVYLDDEPAPHGFQL